MFSLRHKIYLLAGIALGAVLTIALGSLIWLIVGALLGFLISRQDTTMVQHIIIKLKNVTLKIVLVVASLLIVILIIARPWVHGAVMSAYTRPEVVFAVASVALCLFFLRDKKRRIDLILAFLGLSIIFIAASLMHDAIVARYIIADTDYQTIVSLPSSSALRIVPIAVAERYAEDSLQKSREKLGDFDLSIMNGTLSWSAPRIPDGWLISFTQPVQGLMAVNAETSMRKTSLINQELTVGEGIGITDNIYWQVYQEEYFITVPEIFYVFADSTVMAVAPIIRYRFRFPVMVPSFGGVYLISPDGTLTELSPAEIQNTSFLKENRAYPEYLARLTVNAYQYHKGIWNAWVLHQDQIEITDVPGQENQQPFLMPTTEGLQWFIATEPYGKSYGIFKIFMVDAVTGKVAMLELDEDETLIGPVSSVSYVKKHFPTIDWNEARIIEPRPYLIRKKLYWMLSVTPQDFAGISYTVLVDAENNQVLPFQNEEDLAAFIAGGSMPGVNQTGTAQNADALIQEIEERLEQLKRLIEEEKGAAPAPVQEEEAEQQNEEDE